MVSGGAICAALNVTPSLPAEGRAPYPCCAQRCGLAWRLCHNLLQERPILLRVHLGEVVTSSLVRMLWNVSMPMYAVSGLLQVVCACGLVYMYPVATAFHQQYSCVQGPIQPTDFTHCVSGVFVHPQGLHPPVTSHPTHLSPLTPPTCPLSPHPPVPSHPTHLSPLTPPTCHPSPHPPVPSHPTHLSPLTPPTCHPSPHPLPLPFPPPLCTPTTPITNHPPPPTPCPLD